MDNSLNGNVMNTDVLGHESTMNTKTAPGFSPSDVHIDNISSIKGKTVQWLIIIFN